MLHLGKLILHWRAVTTPVSQTAQMTWRDQASPDRPMSHLSRLRGWQQMRCIQPESVGTDRGFYTELGPGSLCRPSICRPMQWLIHLAVLQRIAANALLVAWICYAFLRWWRTAQALPPDRWLPHATTDPSVTTAANALLVAWIFCTLLSWVWTFELSPPEAWEPQARTDPSARIAAKAHFLAWSCCTFLSKPWTFEIFWAVTTSISPQVTILSKRVVCWARPPMFVRKEETDGKRSLEPNCKGS